MTKIPVTFSKHFDLAGNHTCFLRELVPRSPSYSLFYIIYPRYFNEIQEITFFFLQKKN